MLERLLLRAQPLELRFPRLGRLDPLMLLLPRGVGPIGGLSPWNDDPHEEKEGPNQASEGHCQPASRPQLMEDFL